jgi:predicted dinucleotide-binding enzyme
MKIAILGAGNVGATLGKRFTQAGHSVVYGLRQPKADRSDTATVRDACAFGDVVVIALPWPATEEALKGAELTGKVILDATNPLLPDLSGLAVGTTSSGGELVAKWAPGAHVVKIFNTIGFGIMADPLIGGRATSLLYCGDSAEAKSVAADLAKQIGFDPVDAGPLTNARLLEPMALTWIWLAVFGGTGTDFSFQLTRRG